MNRIIASKIVSLLFLLAGLSPQNTTASDLHHYVFFGRDRERISEPSFLATPAFEGAQLKYTWRELEPAKDNYEFAEIEHDLAFLTSKGKKLFLQLQDVSFDIQFPPVPKYLMTDPAYHGGANKQYTVTNDDEEHATPAGWAARRWDPAVQARFHKLLLALGKKFDGRIEGINFAETAIDFGETGRLYPEGFTAEIYRDAILTNMAALKHAFPKSVTIEYANFMFEPKSANDATPYLRQIYEGGRKLGVGLGGPDLLPYKPGQMRNCYPLLQEFAGTIPTAIAVQDGNYAHINPKTGQQVTIPELISFAQNFLKVNYLFWCTEEPYYSTKLIAFLKSPR